MSGELIAQLDIDSALDEELKYVPDLLPKQIVDKALLDTNLGVADHFRQLALAGVPAHPAEKMVALKWRHGRRTVAVLPLYERVLYRAVVNSISVDLAPRTRGKDAYNEFQRSPLESQGVTHVVMADIANYYSSLNLESVATELLRRTGRWSQVEWLRDFWTITSDGYGGIPQMNTSSDIVADTYADLLHRRLLRRGLEVWRYADDFRIACRSYGECVLALETLDESARQLGLSLNERKTLTPSQSRYSEIIEGPQRRLAQISDTVREDLTQFDTYTWEEVSPEDAEVLLEGALRVIDLWLEEQNNPESELPDLTQLLPQTLTVLGISQELRALEAVPHILRMEPQLTASACHYLHLISSDHPFDVEKAVKQSVSGLTLTRWQRLWILNVLEDVGSAITIPWGDQLVLNWMHEQAQDPSVPLRCQAAWSLARANDLHRVEWTSLDADQSEYASQYSAAAIYGVVEFQSQASTVVAPVDPISKEVSSWSKSTYFEPTC